ncbi:hypothetical protein [Nostoc sp.]|uniref:hypothetical protein n=1 Tax=Nostoc sp. TaxID=1180 RepID=UPI002FF7C3CF
MKNFSLSLYAFHLRHTLTELPGEVVTDANLLWENLVKVGESSLTFVGLKDLSCCAFNLHKQHFPCFLFFFPI